MENTLKMIMEKLESMDKKFDRIEATQSIMQEDIATIKREQKEFRIETKVNFIDINAKYEVMTEEIEALVVTNGKMEHRVTILDNRYTKDKTKKNKDLS